MSRYFHIEDAWFEHCNNHAALVVLSVIVSARGGRYTWGQETLARVSHVSMRSLQRHLKMLTDAGLITTDGRTFGEVCYIPTTLALTANMAESVAESERQNGGKYPSNWREADANMAESERQNGGKSIYIEETKKETKKETKGENTRPESPDGGQKIDLYGMALEAWCETYKQNIKQPYNSKWSVTNDLKDLTAKVRSAIINKNRESGMDERSALPTDSEIAETLRGFLLAAYQQGDKFVKEHWDVGYINRHFEELFVLTQSNSQIYNDCKFTEEELADLRRAGIIQ